MGRINSNLKRKILSAGPIGLLVLLFLLFQPGLWRGGSRRPADWPLIQQTRAGYLTQDLRVIALRPSVRIDFHGETFTTNSWGMRDREYEQTPAPRTYRVAIVGPSFVMGSGVSDQDVFEWILEDRLNAEFGGRRYAAYEVLNFAVAGHSALQELYVFENTALQFQPDALFYFSYQTDVSRVIPSLADRISIGAEIPYPWLQEIIRNSGALAGMSQDELETRLVPFSSEIVSQVYRRIVSLAKENGILPVWIYLPILGSPETGSEYRELVREAREAGFITIDLSDVFAGEEVSTVAVAPWDMHPNREGHLLIADRLFDAIVSIAEVSASFGIGP